MEYYDSSCSLEQLQEKNAFVIDRHALRIVQPMIENDDGTFRLDCKNKNGKSVFGRIDFSKGFSDWWHLSHVDFHVPSEHTQEGKRYDGEIQMYHFYSVSGEDAGVNNEVRSYRHFMTWSKA